MLELPYYNTFFKTVAPPTVLLAAKVASLMGGDLQHVFFNNSGSEAIDTVVRLARYYWQAKGEPNRNIIIAPGQRLSRLDHRRRQPGRHEAHARPGRTLGAGHRAHHAALSIQRGLRRGSGGVRRARRPGLGGPDPRGRPRERRRLRRRAGAGGRRGDHPAAELLAADRGHLPQIRHPAGLRRGDLRLRPAGALVRLPALRGEARHGLDGQGPVVRLPADLGGGRRRPHRRDAARGRRRLRARLHLLRPSRPPRRWR